FLCIPKLVKTFEHFALRIHSSIYAVIEIEGVRLLPGMFFSVVFSYLRLLLQFFISELKVCIPINMTMMIFLFECSRLEIFVCLSGFQYCFDFKIFHVILILSEDSLNVELLFTIL